MVIYYDSKTGNVQRFVNKVKKERPDWKFVKIDSEMKVDEEGHLLTFTTKIGETPIPTSEFLEKNSNYIKSISSAGI